MKKPSIFFCFFLLHLSGLTQGGVLAIRNASVIDVKTNKIVSGTVVLIEGNKIIAVSKKAIIPKEATVIDATGKYMIPGLWDMHAHALTGNNYNWLFPMLIANGITGIREMGNNMPLEKINEMRRGILEGSRLGPRIGAATGKILDAVEADFYLAVTTPDQARQIVRTYKQGGADFIKPYNQLSREVYLALVDEARQQNIPVEGHVPFSMTPGEVSDLGQRSIEHNSGVLIYSSTNEAELKKQTQTEPNIWGRYDAQAAKTYNKQKAADLFRQFVRNGTWSCPTIVIFRPLRFSSDSSLIQDSLMKYVPKARRERWHDVFMQRTAIVPDLESRQIRDKMRIEIVGDMYRAGVRLLAGTDTPSPYTIPGFSLHEELQLLVKAGMPPIDALRTATINPALFLGKEKEWGTVEKGKVADLVLLDANPLQDIGNTKKIYAVVVGGRLLQREDLDKLLIEVEQQAKK